MNTQQFKEMMAHWAVLMEQNRNYLVELDSAVGDGDLGLTMRDGFLAASRTVLSSDEQDIGKLAYLAGKAMLSAVPSTMGTLMASGFMRAGKEVRGVIELDLEGMARFFRAFLEGVADRGKASVGDKTFLDGLYPAVESLTADSANSTPIEKAANKAAKKAWEAFQATKEMLAKHGRAAAFGERSKGILDPGAAVAYIMMKGYADCVNKDG